MPKGLDRLERVGKAMPTGGRRHELPACGALRADCVRIETALLPDHAGKELDWKGVLGCPLF
jgi:hypothetical protein